MAAQKSNPNLTQVQYNVLSARVNELTGSNAHWSLYEERKPKLTAAVTAAKKTLKDYDEACAKVSQAVRKQLDSARVIAQEALLFQTPEKALAAVKKLEALK